VPNTEMRTFIAPLTDEEKRKYKEKCKVEGLTSQGAIRKLILEFIGEGKKPC
jgi:hypothetical protein